jgi:hypothetical protein
VVALGRSLDTKPDPRKPTLVRTIDAKEVAARAGYSRPHTVLLYEKVLPLDVPELPQPLAKRIGG